MTFSHACQKKTRKKPETSRGNKLLICKQLRGDDTSTPSFRSLFLAEIHCSRALDSVVLSISALLRRARTVRSSTLNGNAINSEYSSATPAEGRLARRVLVRQVVVQAMAVFLFWWAVDALVRAAIEIYEEFDLELSVNTINFVWRPGRRGLGR